MAPPLSEYIIAEKGWQQRSDRAKCIGVENEQSRGMGKERTAKGGVRVGIETMEERVLLLSVCV